MSAVDTEQDLAIEATRIWIAKNVTQSLKGWIVDYLADDDIEDPDFRNVDRWDLDGIAQHITNMLDNISRWSTYEFESLDDVDSIEQAFSLRGPAGESFYAELVEFFWMNNVDYEEFKKKRHVAEGGSAALYDGAL